MTGNTSFSYDYQLIDNNNNNNNSSQKLTSKTNSILIPQNDTFITSNISSLALQQNNHLCDTVFHVGTSSNGGPKDFYVISSLFAIHSKVFENMYNLNY